MKVALWTILCAGAASSGLVATEALAQQQSATAAVPASSAAQGSTQIQDIVVTAQRREQKLQDVPISVSAVGAPALAAAGATGTVALQVAVPSLVVQRQLSGALPFLRGVGFSVGDTNAENSVAVYVDGVYQPTPAANVFDFSNVERVEVLKGPQGTLFGRNSTGGVIQIVTKTPNQKPEASVNIGYENYDRVTANAYVAGGITDNIAGSVSLLYANQDHGWGHNLTTGNDTFLGRDFGARVKLVGTIDDRTTATLAGDYARTTNTGISGQPPKGAVTISGQPYPGRYNTYGNDDDFSKIRNRGVSLTVDHDADIFVVKSISAYRKFNGRQSYDQDLSPIPLVTGDFYQNTRMITQELHIYSEAASKFQWLVGAYFFDYKAASDPTRLLGVAFAPFAGLDGYGQTDARSYSLFAQGTYPIAHETNLTLGGRYTFDRSVYQGSVVADGTDIVLDPYRRLKLSYERPTWRISLDHKFSPDVMAYLSYNRGVKSGNFSVNTPPSAQRAYRPERIDAFELGAKSELFDKRVIFNTAAFHYNFKNIQFQRLTAGLVTIFNGPSSTIYGGEVDVTARATSRLTLTANAGLLHTEIGNFPNAPNSVRIPTGQTIDGPSKFNAKGNKLANAPSFSGNIGFNYRIPVGSGNVFATSNLYYTDHYYTEPDNRLSVQKHILLNASLGWEAQKGLRISVWGKNLTNVYYYGQLASQAGVSDVGSAAAPRTYGITAGFSF